MDAVAITDTSSRPGDPPISPRKRVLTAPDGYLFVKGRGTMLVREREKSELYVVVIRSELQRCGVLTRKIKVRIFDGIFYLNIFYLRGLDPDLAIAALQKLPPYCGVKRVMAALDQLEQRVERVITAA